MTKMLDNKLAKIPKSPGVYFYKDKSGDIIYIGKAAVLRNRVRQYFQKSRARDPKTEALIAEIADVEWTEVETELDALFLEAELIRRYMPRYNILLRDDKSLTYVRIDYDAKHPTVTLTRRPLDDGARYMGPYFSALAVRRALKYLRRIFPYSTHANSIPKRNCLQVHLGLCPGLESGQTSLQDYRLNLRRLMQYLKGERVKLMRDIEREMKAAAKVRNFEQAAKLRNQYTALKGLSRQIVFSDREGLDISKDLALSGLAELLGLAAIPRRIEGYDISHLQGTDNVASMVVFVSGVPDKAAYRKFKLRVPGNDDYAHINEALIRRLRENNRKKWGVPDMCLIDGGRGQLTAAIEARDKAGLDIPMIGLAKRDEELVVHKTKSNVRLNTEALQSMAGHRFDTEAFTIVSLPHSSHIVKLLQRIRDESHRFAVSYHSVLKTKRQTASLLDDIPGVGPSTRKKLLKAFGSMKGVLQADQAALEKVVGAKKAATLHKYLRAHRKSSPGDI
ncbi:MAG: excinuclease ABC subunit UvrC [Candidatus Saccharibacteria bacterium]|nr:excinuclease ABC subunit UvrC [Candidatus Saccharibacteria bacterium]